MTEEELQAIGERAAAAAIAEAKRRAEIEADPETQFARRIQQANNAEEVEAIWQERAASIAPPPMPIEVFNQRQAELAEALVASYEKGDWRAQQEAQLALDAFQHSAEEMGDA